MSIIHNHTQKQRKKNLNQGYIIEPQPIYSLIFVEHKVLTIVWRPQRGWEEGRVFKILENWKIFDLGVIETQNMKRWIIPDSPPPQDGMPP